MALNRVVPGAVPNTVSSTVPVAIPVAVSGAMSGALPALSIGMPAGSEAAREHAGRQTRWTLGEMTGRSAPMERLFLQMRYLANHLRLALLEGERGTGKQLVARTLHELGAQRRKGFVACPAREFFRDADSAAVLLEAAQGGTLYLFGVDALDHEQQSRLLHLARWMQGKGAATPVRFRTGPAQGTPVAPRVLLVSAPCALRPLVLYGKFRGDLQQHLSPIHLLLPPLRERREDIALLAERFLSRLAGRCGGCVRGLAPDVLSTLLAHTWPGNVAELESVIERGFARAVSAGSEWVRRLDLLRTPGGEDAHVAGAQRLSRSMAPILRLPHRNEVSGRHQQNHQAFAPDRFAGNRKPESQKVFDAEKGMPGIAPEAALPEETAILEAADYEAAHYDPNLDRAIQRHIEYVLSSVDGNKLRAARMLGISRSTLYRHLESAHMPSAPSEPHAARSSGALSLRNAVCQ